MKKLGFLIFLLVVFSLIATACDTTFIQDLTGKGGAGQPGGGSSPGMGGGMMGGMHSRHMAQIPPGYAGLRNLVPADESSLERGGEIYPVYCASCHGDGGMGDGPAGASLNPPASPVAHTSMMMGDDYLFWRISEGGLDDPFNSSMPAWKNSLSEEARWDVINYIRALGRGEIKPGKAVGGKPFDPAEEVAQRTEMLSEAIALDVITEGEAETFNEVHMTIDLFLVEQKLSFTGRMEDVVAGILDELVQTDVITEQQADTFLDVHDRLVEAGLME